MRITGGQWKNRTIKTPKTGVRPTSDKVRQAIFNMIESRFDIQGAHVLDAFCGSGALGLEALSRGASYCTFWDNSKNSLQITKENIAALNAQNYSKCVFQDATKPSEKPAAAKSFDLVFLDPPYRQDLVPVTIRSLQTGQWIQDGVMFVVETAKDEDCILPALEILQDKTYGDTRIILALQNSSVDET